MALTEKYVSALAGGSGDGLSAGAAFIFDQMVTEIKSAGGTGGQGKRYNVKADGTYVRTVYDDMGGTSGTGTELVPVHIRGYKTTIGDGYLGRSATTGALITTNMPLVDYSATDSRRFISGRYTCVESMHFKVMHGPWALDVDNGSLAIGCVVYQLGDGNSAGVRLAQDAIAHECDCYTTVTSGNTSCVVIASAVGVKIDSCRIVSACATAGCIKPEQHTLIYGCLMKGAGGPGVFNQERYMPFTVRNCTIVGCSDAIRSTVAMEYGPWICGNMLTDNSATGLSFTSHGHLMLGPNRFRDNSAAGISTTSEWINVGRLAPFILTDTGGPETDYVDFASGNCVLLAASPAHNQNVPIYSDLGAHGAADPAGGGGGTVFNPLAQTIIRSA